METTVTLKVGDTIRLRVEKTYGPAPSVFLLHTPIAGQDDDMGGALIVSSLGYEGSEEEETLEVVATNNQTWGFGEGRDECFEDEYGAHIPANKFKFCLIGGPL